MDLTPSILQEFFGTSDQQALQRRAAALFELVRDDQRFATHGRALGVADYADAPELQAALARNQGVGPCDSVPRDTVADHRRMLEAGGLQTDCYNNWRGGAETIVAARDLVKTRSMPDDLIVKVADWKTDPVEMAAIADATQSCDVLLPAGAFMRGTQRDAVCVYAMEANGRVVGTSASVLHCHPDHQRKKEAWWGMLSTREERRGQGIALLLGAKAMILMHERYGAARFVTGIREGNAASEYLCAKLGLQMAGDCAVVAIDPAAFSGGRLTK